MSRLTEMGQAAKDAAVILARLSSNEKNSALAAAAEALEKNMDKVLEANKKDVDAAVKNGIKGAFIDRLTLTETRVREMADGLRSVAKLDDPVGEVIYMKTLDNGLKIGQKRVPMGVIGIIFEARPNVTADAFGLCLKAGSATILRGGKEAFNSNTTIVNIFRDALEYIGLPKDCVQMVEDTSRTTAAEMMRLNGYIDVLIPRGGAGLIQSVVQNSTVPIIETGTGNCHTFVDKSADLDMAVRIVINAKTQRPGVCNACESLLVHEDIAETFIPMVVKALKNNQVEIRGDKRFLYSAIHLARFDSYSDNTATPGLILKTTSCHRMVMLRHLIRPAPSRRPNTGSAQSTGNKQLSQFSAHFYLISFTRIPLSCSSVMVLPALK